ncbi:serine protease inhibitor 42Dd-like isoform X2 [Episyrphus balteatus]|uniref:serine protease inhibitor 42Dd-like isoform X2 n=1 Tax=Episyrphus balteatus TaxID=286459 RepID=UPI002486C4C5|nr:serine protease inhibitor 42Dd-like isoform X2 [Episyrphus balteatus]
MELFYYTVIFTSTISTYTNVWPQGKALDSSYPSKGSFPSVLFNQISKENENKNIIISPFSIQSALTLLYMGAEGNTAKEFQNLLHFSSSNKTEIAENFQRIKNSMMASSGQKAQIQSAERIYTRFNLVPKFNQIASKYFQAQAEKVNFNLREQTANKINTWVENNTNNKITNLISPESIDDHTTAILVNALYFKAPWANQFNKRLTRKKPFYMSARKSVNVDTMSDEITCKYVRIPELDATAIELRYEDTDLVMDVILPNEVSGLKDLENSISVMDLGKLFENVTEEEVKVNLPKFRIEFETGLIPVLQDMGMKESFQYGANYTGIFNTKVPVKVSDVIHKAFIEVNEFGSEAAASTYTKLVYLSAFSDAEETFTADHPFMFVIRNPSTVYFVGHVKNFDS